MALEGAAGGGLAGSGLGMSRAVLSRRMNRFNFGSEIHNRAAIIAGGRRASQHSCKSSSSAVAGFHGLKVRGIASILIFRSPPATLS
jgi:hypothetical protein